MTISKKLAHMAQKKKKKKKKKTDQVWTKKPLKYLFSVIPSSSAE